MGFLDFFKKKQRTETLTYGDKTYEVPKSISAEEYQRIRQKEIDRLERKFDLSTIDGINAIPVPKSKSSPSAGAGSITGRIDYYIMLKAGQYEKNGETELALACYRKANALMEVSPIAYQYDSYMRLPRYLRKLRRFDEARLEEAKIDVLFPDNGVYEMSKSEFMRDMKSAGNTQKSAEELYREYKADRDAEKQKHLYRLDYDWLWEFLPDICPKSFSGYMRMKNANSDKFQKIVATAKEHGYNIK